MDAPPADVRRTGGSSFEVAGDDRHGRYGAKSGKASTQMANVRVGTLRPPGLVDPGTSPDRSLGLCRQPHDAARIELASAIGTKAAAARRRPVGGTPRRSATPRTRCHAPIPAGQWRGNRVDRERAGQHPTAARVGPTMTRSSRRSAPSDPIPTVAPPGRPTRSSSRRATTPSARTEDARARADTLRTPQRTRSGNATEAAPRGRRRAVARAGDTIQIPQLARAILDELTERRALAAIPTVRPAVEGRGPPT